MQKFTKKAAVVPFFTPIIVLIVATIIIICSLIWTVHTNYVEEQAQNVEQTQECVQTN
jgi:energy-converting hydrogenase Eha subunit H